VSVLVRNELKNEHVDPLLDGHLIQCVGDIFFSSSKTKISKVKEQVITYFRNNHPDKRYNDILELLTVLRSDATEYRERCCAPLPLSLRPWDED
jgi:hypothetical protein